MFIFSCLNCRASRRAHCTRVCWLHLSIWDMAILSLEPIYSFHFLLNGGSGCAWVDLGQDGGRISKGGGIQEVWLYYGLCQALLSSGNMSQGLAATTKGIITRQQRTTTTTQGPSQKKVSHWATRLHLRLLSHTRRSPISAIASCAPNHSFPTNFSCGEKSSSFLNSTNTQG